MSGLIVHGYNDMQGWHSIETPPFGDTHTQCLCCDNPLDVVYSVSNHDHNIGVVCCDHCGYVGYDKMPMQDWLDNYYAGAWMAGESLNPGSKHPLASIILGAIPKEKSILEIGCGKGTCLAVLRSNGYQKLAGVEQSVHRAEASAKHTGLDINEDWPDGRWELITSHHVLEHILHPGEFFEKASERQNAGDFILLVVPKAEWEPILGQLLFLLHLHSFSGDALESLANKHGYNKAGDGSTATCVVHLYAKAEVQKPDLLGHYVDTMNIKLARGLRLSESVKHKELKWRIFDTHATYLPITDPHRSLTVSTGSNRAIHFDSNQSFFVK